MSGGSKPLCATGLALIAAEGDREKRGKEEYARTMPARQLFRAYADQHFFPALWDQMQAQTDAERAKARLAFVRKLAKAAEREFYAAKPAIPCVRIMRHRAELRGEQALQGGLRKAISVIDAEETLHGT